MVPLPSFSGPGGLGAGRGWSLSEASSVEKTGGTHTEKLHLYWQPQALPWPPSWAFGAPHYPSPQPAGLCKKENEQ